MSRRSPADRAGIVASLRRAGRAGILVASIPPALSGYVLHEALTPEAARTAVRDRWLRAWSALILRVFGVALERAGQVAPPTPGRGRLIVANHRSALDIGLVFACFGGRLVSRADLAGWPLLGRGARRIGTLFVDRASALSGAAVIRRLKTVLAAGEHIAIFPEGTTFSDDRVRPFHAGAFAAARAARAEVLPVGIAYASGSEAAFGDETFPEHVSRLAAAPRTRVVLGVGELVPTAGTTAELALRAQAAVQRLVDEARVRVDGG